MSRSSARPWGATGREEVVERVAQPIPAGQHMAVLAPGEDPGNGAQIVNALGAETAGRARADLQERQFLDRACGVEIAEQGLVLGQLAIGLEGQAGDFLNRLLMFRD